MDAHQVERSRPRAIVQHVIVVYAVLTSMVVVAVVGSLMAEIHPLAGRGGALAMGALLLWVLRGALNRLAEGALGQPSGYPSILLFIAWPVGIGLAIAPLAPAVRVAAAIAVVGALAVFLLDRRDQVA